MRYLTLLALLPLISCSPRGEFARAFVIEDLDQAIGGPKAIAQPGDILLENDQVRFAILSDRHSMGPGIYGGSLVDADLQYVDPRLGGGNGRDEFNELFPTVNMNVTFTEDPDDEPASPGSPRDRWEQFPSQVSITQDGTSGAAVVTVGGPGVPFLSMLGALWALVGAPDQYITSDYILEPGDSWLTIRTTASYGDYTAGPDLSLTEPVGYHETAFPLLEWALETGVVMGDFYLSGGSLDVFAPGIGFDEDGAVFQAMEAGENTFNTPFEFPFLAGVGDGISYGIAPRYGTGFVPLFTASQTVYVGGGRIGDGTDDRFPEGTNLTYERFFFVGHGDVGSLVDGYVQAREIPHGRVVGNVLEQATGQPLSGVDVFVYEPGARNPWSQWETDVHPDDTVEDGSFAGLLPVGKWEILAHQQGRPDPKRVEIEVRQGEDVTVQLGARRAGTLSLTVEDETGLLVPAKVTLFRLDGAPSRDPVLKDPFIAGNPETVLFATYGTGEVDLPPGTYQAVASRGIEYEIDISKPFVIDENRSADIQLQVIRAIDSEGWISADLHVHGENSHDSGVSQAARVQTMVCEGVEFFASTDHDYITDYAPVVEEMGLEPWVQTTVGNETTTIEIGHFLAFPLQQDFLGDAGGAFDWTEATPSEILGTLDEQAKSAGFEDGAVTFVGHPRDGILGYFDQYGFSPFGGQPGIGGAPGTPLVRQPLLSATNPLLQPSLLSWDFDGIELLNGKRFDFLRIPLQHEVDGFVAEDGTGAYEWISRTLDEQERLEEGIYTLGAGVNGQIDDWFSLLNLGYRFTALGNSDTHGTTTVESGCPRNFVVSTTDDPQFIDDEEIARAVKEHRVVASYGPFVRFWVDDVPIGEELTPEDGEVEVEIEVQAPSWIDVDRIELYQNGRLIEEWEVSQDGPLHVFEGKMVTLTEDSWFTVMVMGDSDMRPVFTPVEIPYIDLQAIITEALGSVDAVSNLISPAVPLPRKHPVYPFALTNPIWVDLDGDGFDAPGIPEWFREPDGN